VTVPAGAFVLRRGGFFFVVRCASVKTKIRSAPKNRNGAVAGGPKVSRQRALWCQDPALIQGGEVDTWSWPGVSTMSHP